jgi:uncharacterized membrane-anchored protein YhcB (DUF1043 family)
MYFIVNKTKKTIIISDIKGCSLGPRQAVDLYKITNKHIIEQSKDLKHAIKRGEIEVRIKDGEHKSSGKVKSQKHNNNDTLENFKREIVDEVKETVKDISKELISQQQKPVNNSGMSNEDLDILAQKIIQNMPVQEKIANKEENINNKEVVEIENEALSEIHKRTVNKMVKNIESSDINYEEEKAENNLDNYISELEDLLD